MQADLKTWRFWFLNAGLDGSLADAYCSHVDQMLAYKRPAIFGFSHLAMLLGRSRSYLASAAMAPPAHYRRFRIPKKRGGELRSIDAPYPALLECQQWISNQIIDTCEFHQCSHGFIRGRSIKSNAAVHLGARHLMKMDLRGFFPSIGIRRVIAAFKGFGYPPNIAFLLARLCTLDDRLPQGAATSPPLSNVIAFRLDKRLHGLAKKCSLNYSRYADDLTFSGKRLGTKFPQIVTSIVRDEGFEVREDKTRLLRGGGQRIVTGIDIGSGTLRVPRSLRRELRQTIHYLKTYGPRSHVARLKIRRPFYLHELLGKLSFWAWVESDSEFAMESVAYLQELLSERSN